MNADCKGALEQLDRSHKAFVHNGRKMSKQDVKKVLEYAISKGYKHTGQISDAEIDSVLTDLFGNQVKQAHFSVNRKHRHWLYREWDRTKPVVTFIGLNPSTANESTDDPTIRKVTKIAANNGYGRFYMLNLYTCVTAHPQYIVDYPSIEEILLVWRSSFEFTSVVFCWGNFKQAQARAPIVIQKFPSALCIDRNKNGSPKHPLYCKDNSKLIPFHHE